MKYVILENIRVKTSQGETVLKQGQVIKLSEIAAEKLLKAGKIKLEQTDYEPSQGQTIWKNDYNQSSPAARRHALMEIMNAMIEQAIRDFQETSYRFAPTEEEQAERIYHLVLAGQRKLADFEKAVDNWKQAATIRRNEFLLN